MLNTRHMSTSRQAMMIAEVVAHCESACALTVVVISSHSPAFGAYEMAHRFANFTTSLD